jgi:serine/threonine-protein kinase
MSGEESHDPIGRKLGNKFLVRRVIGRGGMGIVYEVEHLVTKKIGALKLLYAQHAAQPRVVERFVREASAAGRIGNPHIVEAFDAGELPSGEPYMFMELLDGSPVRELLEERGRLSFDEAREIVLQAAEGLAAAHASGIVHRDIKPENLFLCRGDRAFVKLVDFGISKFDVEGEHRLTTEGAPLGTPYYMSPEQVTGTLGVDARSDVYSLGVVLYECVTGKVPFDAPTLPALSIKILEGEYAPPSRLRGEAPQGLDELVARAIAVEPSRRYATMNEFHAALARLGGEGPVVDLAGTMASAPDDKVAAPRVESRGTVDVARSRRGLYLGLAGAGVVAASVVVFRSNAPDEAPDRSEATAAEASASSTALVASAPLTVSAVPSKPSAAPAASSAVVPPPPVAARAPSAARSATRAGRDGLSEENPFAK